MKTFLVSFPVEMVNIYIVEAKDEADAIERVANGDCGVNGIATLLQHVHADPGCQMLGRDHHAVLGRHWCYRGRLHTGATKRSHAAKQSQAQAKVGFHGGSIRNKQRATVAGKPQPMQQRELYPHDTQLTLAVAMLATKLRRSVLRA